RGFALPALVVLELRNHAPRSTMRPDRFSGFVVEDAAWWQGADLGETARRIDDQATSNGSLFTHPRFQAWEISALLTELAGAAPNSPGYRIRLADFRSAVSGFLGEHPN